MPTKTDFVRTALTPSEAPAERVRVDEERELLHPVDRDDGDPLAEAALELGIPFDVDLLELEGDVAPNLLDDAGRALAEVAAGRRVERDGAAYG